LCHAIRKHLEVDPRHGFSLLFGQTLKPGGCPSAEIISSDSPSEKYCWFLSLLSLTSGSTAIDLVGMADASAGATAGAWRRMK
jgi:hypothetical protein